MPTGVEDDGVQTDSVGPFMSRRPRPTTERMRTTTTAVASIRAETHVQRMAGAWLAMDRVMMAASAPSFLSEQLQLTFGRLHVHIRLGAFFLALVVRGRSMQACVVYTVSFSYVWRSTVTIDLRKTQKFHLVPYFDPIC